MLSDEQYISETLVVRARAMATQHGNSHGSDLLRECADDIERLRAERELLVQVAEAATAAVANDLEWEAFDYKTSDRVPENDSDHTKRMTEALEAWRARTK